MRILVLILLLATPAFADEQVEKLFALARRVNPTLRDYSAEMTLKLDAVLGFIPYHPTMSGHYYFKRPNKHKLDLPKAPSYLKKYPTVFGFNLPRLENYESKVAGEVDVNGRPCYQLKLKNLKTANNDIKNLEIYVDKANYTVPRYDTYYGGGHLFVNSVYVNVDGFWVFDKMSAEYEAQAVSVKAEADYKNYKFNTNLADSLFSSAP